MRYRLRTLLIVLAVGPVVLASVWFGWQYATETDEVKYRRFIEERMRERGLPLTGGYPQSPDDRAKEAAERQAPSPTPNP